MGGFNPQMMQQMFGQQQQPQGMQQNPFQQMYRQPGGMQGMNGGMFGRPMNQSQMGGMTAFGPRQSSPMNPSLPWDPQQGGGGGGGNMQIGGGGFPSGGFGGVGGGGAPAGWGNFSQGPMPSQPRGWGQQTMGGYQPRPSPQVTGQPVVGGVGTGMSPQFNQGRMPELREQQNPTGQAIPQFNQMFGMRR